MHIALKLTVQIHILHVVRSQVNSFTCDDNRTVLNVNENSYTCDDAMMEKDDEGK